jgi:hypothetical protein
VAGICSENNSLAPRSKEETGRDIAAGMRMWYAYLLHRAGEIIVRLY